MLSITYQFLKLFDKENERTHYHQSPYGNVHNTIVYSLQNVKYGCRIKNGLVK